MFLCGGVLANGAKFNSTCHSDATTSFSMAAIPSSILVLMVSRIFHRLANHYIRIIMISPYQQRSLVN